LALSANQSFFYHYHVLPDGTIISHAHPYNKTTDCKPIKSHHHSSFEISFFGNLGVTNLETSIAYNLHPENYTIEKIVDKDHLFCSNSSITISGRAPPYSI
jgi:hypothetical protein